jgi:hypothetical protein
MSAVAIVLLALAIAADSRRPRLAEVVRSGDEVRALRMLDDGADPNQRDLKGITPLMWAAALGRIEVAGRLLDRGAALNAETGGGDAGAGDTALTFAAANGNTAMVDFLLSRGAVPGRFGDWSRLPGDYRDKLVKISGFVSSAARYVNPSAKDFSEVEAFLRTSPPGADKSALNELLCLAAAQGRDDFVDRLLQLGASPLADARGTMAFEMALRSAGSHSPHRVRTALRLLKAGQPIRIVQRAVRNDYVHHLWLATCSVEVGQEEQARDEVRKALAMRPALTISSVMAEQPWKRSEDAERIEAALLRAHLPPR